MASYDLQEQPIHLGLGATAVAEPAFTGIDWYEDYAKRHGSDGAEARLVSLHRFAAPWDIWEMHPQGSEVVLCLEGELTVVQEQAGEEVRIPLTAGRYAINPPGVWHTADVEGEATCLFITAGLETEHRPRG